MNLAIRYQYGFQLTVVILAALYLNGCGMALQSVEKDKEIGQKVAVQVAAEMGIVQDADDTRYLNTLGRRVVKVNPDQTFEYQFFILDQYVPNAFAVPGGYIFISRGLLVLTNNEDELANVVGHEIAHVSYRHSARRMAQARAPGVLALPGNIVGGVVSRDLGNLINAPVNLVGGAYLASHSRQDEFEADQLGQRLAAEAGYDPSKLAHILVRLEQFAEVQTGEKRIPGFFDTHPSTPDREERVLRDAQQIQWTRKPGVASSNAAYLKQWNGMIVGADPAMGVFDGQMFLQPDLDFAVQFPQGWKVLNTRQAVYTISPSKNSVLALGIAGKGTDPEQAGKQFEQAMRGRYQIEPSVSRKENVNNLPAYLLAYTDDSGKEPMYMAFLWIAHKGLIYQFIGLVPESYREPARRTAFSFRPLTGSERQSIKMTVLKMVSGRSNESLDQLSNRPCRN